MTGNSLDYVDLGRLKAVTVDCSILSVFIALKDRICDEKTYSFVCIFFFFQTVFSTPHSLTGS